jgi:hypothetical protein
LTKWLGKYNTEFRAVDFRIKVPKAEMEDYISYLRKILEPFPEQVAKEFEDDIALLRARMEKYGMQVPPYWIAIVTKE